MRKDDNPLLAFIKNYLFTIILSVAIAVMMVVGFRETAEKRRIQSIQTASDSLMRAIVTCYAIEGCYPESYDYIKENYEICINENKLIVFYSALGSNIMPSFRIIEKR